MPYKNKEDQAARDKRYRQENIEKKRAYGRQYYFDNRELYRDKDNARARKWAKDNPEKMRANCAKRKAAKLQRTPSWADDLVIRMIYEDCPEGMEVDHIIPLQGEIVSGLHVAHNLQYLTKSENCSKGNKFNG